MERFFLQHRSAAGRYFEVLIVLVSVSTLLMTGCESKSTRGADGRVYDIYGEFSFVPPVDFKIDDDEISRSRLSAINEDGLAYATLMFLETERKTSLKEHVAIHIVNVKKTFPDASIVHLEDFKISPSLDGIKFATRKWFKSVEMLTNSYIFDIDDHRYEFSFTTSVDRFRGLEPEIDKSVRTLRKE
ncbi:MAG: hypothetical protein KCHDKBKB_01176 [Elusimicrobia bacterium]|nr:hypothetical protein [Elusimicrobiota bacterium]